MKGEARIRKNGDAIKSPAQTAAQSIVKIVLFRQNMVPSPFIEGLALVVMNRIWACGGGAEVTTVTLAAVLGENRINPGFSEPRGSQRGRFWAGPVPRQQYRRGLF